MVCASDSVPPRQRVAVQALIRELTACMLCHAVKKKKKKECFLGPRKCKTEHWKRRSRWSGKCQCLWPTYIYPSGAVSTTGPSNVDPRPCVGCEIGDG